MNHKDARNPNSILSGSEYLVRLRSHKMDNNAFCRNMLNLVCFFDIRTLLKRSRQIRFFVIYPEFKEFLGKMKILEPFLKFWIFFFKNFVYFGNIWKITSHNFQGRGQIMTPGGVYSYKTFVFVQLVPSQSTRLKPCASAQLPPNLAHCCECAIFLCYFI